MVQDQAAIQNHLSAVAETEHRFVIRQILDIIEQDKAKAQRILFMITSGGFDEAPTADTSRLPASQSKWRTLSNSVVKGILTHIYPAHEESINGLKGKLVDLLCFVLNSDPSSCVYSMVVAQLKDEAFQRQREVGIGFQSIAITNNKVDWSRCGFFELRTVEAVKYLRHTISGMETRLPESIQNQDFELVSNHSFVKAGLKTSLISITCLSVFQDVGMDLTEQPEFLMAVRDGSNDAAPATPAVTTSPASGSS